jgi:hypothetical protein
MAPIDEPKIRGRRFASCPPRAVPLSLSRDWPKGHGEPGSARLQRRCNANILFATSALQTSSNPESRL